VSTRIIALTGKQAANVNVLYLGTATYDLPGPRHRQTARFVEAGCTVDFLEVVDAAPSLSRMSTAVGNADVIIVSGGNTLFAVDRWVRLGMKEMLREAMMRGAVLTGGSAGAICWFDAGHSDSMDPDTFKGKMLAAAAAEGDKGGDESSTAPASGAPAKTWEYIRVDGLGFLPGLVCPHHDKVQSNGVLRANDFDAMLLRHSRELGIGIDHWAGVQIWCRACSEDHSDLLHAVEKARGLLIWFATLTLDPPVRPSLLPFLAQRSR
jgi:dipeptidase E